MMLLLLAPTASPAKGVLGAWPIGGSRDHPFFFKYTLPDLLLIRHTLRAAGCKCNLVTLLRHPLLQHLS